MIACRSCKTENLDGAQYCDECGALLNDSLFVEQIEAVKANDFDASREARKEQAESSVAIISESTDSAQSSRAVISSTNSAHRHDGPHAKLIIQRGNSTGKEFTLSDNEIYIGRWDADSGIFPDVDLDVDDPEAKVSRRHARIVRHQGQYYIEDLGSTNGTFINRGKRLQPGDQQPLFDGDEVIVGKTFLLFQKLT